MKKASLIIGALVAMSALAASNSWAADKPVIGLVMKSLANPFYKTMVDGAQAYEAERGDFVLKAVGMQSETDVDTQLTAIDSMITQQVDAIIIIPGLAADLGLAIESRDDQEQTNNYEEG